MKKVESITIFLNPLRLKTGLWTRFDGSEIWSVSYEARCLKVLTPGLIFYGSRSVKSYGHRLKVKNKKYFFQTHFNESRLIFYSCRSLKVLTQWITGKSEFNILLITLLTCILQYIQILFKSSSMCFLLFHLASLQNDTIVMSRCVQLWFGDKGEVGGE